MLSMDLASINLCNRQQAGFGLTVDVIGILSTRKRKCDTQRDAPLAPKDEVSLKWLL